MLKKIIPPHEERGSTESKTLRDKLDEKTSRSVCVCVCVCVCVHARMHVCALKNRSQLGNMIIISQYLNILIRLIKLGNVSSSIEGWISC